jgi:hypothetical protein
MSERIMIRAKHSDELTRRRDPRSDDLKDWVAIGMIIVASSLLLWAPLFI